MKKLIFVLLALCLVLAGCSGETPAVTEATQPVTDAAVPETEAPTEAPVTVSPMPQGIDLNQLEDCTLAVSLEEGDVYEDDSGVLQMKATVYTYDLYDMVDIAALSHGDILVFRCEEVKIDDLQHLDDGSLHINGSLTLRTDGDGCYYGVLENDHPAYYALGEATIRVSPDFIYTDSSDPSEEKTIYPGDFLVPGMEIDYDFTPYNTTIRIENGKVIEMHRIYIP